MSGEGQKKHKGPRSKSSIGRRFKCNSRKHLEEALSCHITQKLDVANLCQENYEPRFVEIARLCRCRFLSSSGQIVAILDEKICINVDYTS